MTRPWEVSLSGALAWIQSVLDGGVSFFYPPVCQLCRDFRADGADGYVCSGCLSTPGALRPIETGYCSRCGLPFEGDVGETIACSNCRGLDLGFDWARASLVATPFVLDLVHRYKYRGGYWLEPLLMRLFVRQAMRELRAEDWDWVVPVPLHPVRERERGFNQARQLAVALSGALGIGMNDRVLERVRQTETQTALNRAQRRNNMSSAFRARPGATFLDRGGRVLLVDDILTTGATTGACARVLKQAGAVRACVWTLARGN